MAFEKGDLVKTYNSKYAIVLEILNDQEVMLMISGEKVKYKTNRLEPCFQYIDNGEFDGNMSYINFSKANFIGLLNEAKS